MAKYFGKIGYTDTVETSPGIWEEKIISVREYSGDVLRITRRFQNGESINDDLQVSNQISIIADPYAYNNISKMRWIEWLGTKWIISSIDVEYPRLRIDLGGVWNGEYEEE